MAIKRTLIISHTHLSWLALAAVLICALGPSAVLAQSKSTSVDNPVASKSDNSGKRLAVANFVPDVEESKKSMVKSVETLKKSVATFSKDVNDNYVPKVKNKKVTIEVPNVEIPTSLQDLCQDSIVGGQQMAQFVREHAEEFAYLMAKYLKQFTDPPTATPIGSPYHSDGRIIQHNSNFLDFGKKSTNLFFTPEGRLKTVVQR